MSPATSCAEPAANVGVTLSPGTIVANGTSTTVATATVTDVNNTLIPGDAITFKATPAADVNIGTVTDNGNGTYSATITSNANVTFTDPTASVTITATDTSVTSSTVSGSAPLTLDPPPTNPAANVGVSFGSNRIVANGTSTTTATATVTDAGSQPVPGDTIVFKASPAGVSIGAVTYQGNGAYAATITSSTTAGPVTITATDTSVTSSTVAGQSTLTLTAGPATSVAVSLNPSTITASASSSTIATATVTDAHGNLVSGDTIQFSAGTPADVSIGPVTDDNNGTYTATIAGSAATTFNGGSTSTSTSITATDSSVTPATVSPSQTLTIDAPTTANQAAGVGVSLQSSQIAASGTSTTDATATVTDTHGNPVTGDNLQFTASPAADVAIGSVVNNGNGTYTVTVTSTTNAFFTTTSTTTAVTITATDLSVSSRVSGSTTLTLEELASSLQVSITPVAIYADGQSHAFVTASATEVNGTPAVGDAVQFYDNSQLAGLPCTTDSTGECHVTLTSSTTPGVQSITATDTTANLPSANTVTLTLLPIPAAPQATGSTGTSVGTTTPATSTTGASPIITEIVASLAGKFVPKGGKASIRSILRAGGYAYSYLAPGQGSLTLDWYSGSGKQQKLIGSVSAKLRKAGKTAIKLKLSKTGRVLLGRSRRSLVLSSKASFKAIGAKSGVSRTARFTLHY